MYYNICDSKDESMILKYKPSNFDISIINPIDEIKKEIDKLDKKYMKILSCYNWKHPRRKGR